MHNPHQRSNSTFRKQSRQALCLYHALTIFSVTREECAAINKNLIYTKRECVRKISVKCRTVLHSIVANAKECLKGTTSNKLWGSQQTSRNHEALECLTWDTLQQKVPLMCLPWPTSSNKLATHFCLIWWYNEACNAALRGHHLGSSKPVSPMKRMCGPWGSWQMDSPQKLHPTGWMCWRSRAWVSSWFLIIGWPSKHVEPSWRGTQHGETLEKLIGIRKTHEKLQKKVTKGSHKINKFWKIQKHFTEVLLIRNALHPQFAARASVHPSWFGTFDILAGWKTHSSSMCCCCHIFPSLPGHSKLSNELTYLSRHQPVIIWWWKLWNILKRCSPSHASQFSVGHNPSWRSMTPNGVLEAIDNKLHLVALECPKRRALVDWISHQAVLPNYLI